MRRVDLAHFCTANVTVGGDNTYVFPNSDAQLFAEFASGTFLGERVSHTQYLILDVENLTDSTCTITCFFETDTGVLSVKTAVLPQLFTRIAYPFSITQGGTLYPKRTPGRLKTVVGGQPIRLEQLRKFAICTAGRPGGITLKLSGMYVSDTEPDYPMTAKPMLDALGQKHLTDWQGKTHGEDELSAVLRAEADVQDEQSLPYRSRYGGWKQKQFTSTGYFALQHDGRRWWLLDPDGYAFFSTGFDCMAINTEAYVGGNEQLCQSLPGKDSECWSVNHWNGDDSPNTFNFARYNLIRAFGKDYHNIWSALMRRRMLRWGMNTTACWSDPAYIKKAGLPYVISGGSYPTTQKCIFRDFPDVCSPEFAANAKKWAQFLVPYAQDKLLIGYFMANEPKWAFVQDLNIAALTLSSDEHFFSKGFIIDLLIQKYGTTDALNTAWGTAFASFDALWRSIDTHGCAGKMQEDLIEISGEMIRLFIKIPALAAKEVDPHHLNLGIRYAWLSHKMLANGCEYTDVFSFNCYEMDPTDTLSQFASLTGKPLLIGEFHFGATDRGLDAPGLRAVADQAARGDAYRYYVHRAAAHPHCLGAHYFMLYDQSYLGRYDGENYQIGALDVCSRPYTEFIEGIVRTNTEIYEVADGLIPPTEEQATEIGSLMR